VGALYLRQQRIKTLPSSQTGQQLYGGSSATYDRETNILYGKRLKMDEMTLLGVKHLVVGIIAPYACELGL
jgi:hypothetical protein